MKNEFNFIGDVVLSHESKNGEEIHTTAYVEEVVLAQFDDEGLPVTQVTAELQDENGNDVGTVDIDVTVDRVELNDCFIHESGVQNNHWECSKISLKASNIEFFDDAFIGTKNHSIEDSRIEMTQCRMEHNDQF
ncbi:hypothetical protein QTO02_00155 [Vibrio fortis]